VQEPLLPIHEVQRLINVLIALKLLVEIASLFQTVGLQASKIFQSVLAMSDDFA
jgi:hypothetical protein